MMIGGSSLSAFEPRLVKNHDTALSDQVHLRAASHHVSAFTQVLPSSDRKRDEKACSKQLKKEGILAATTPRPPNTFIPSFKIESEFDYGGLFSRIQPTNESEAATLNNLALQEQVQRHREEQAILYQGEDISGALFRTIQSI